MPLLGVRIHAPDVLTYLLTQNNQCFGRWAVIQFPDFSVYDLSSVPLLLVSPKIAKITNVLYGYYFAAASRCLRCYCRPLLMPLETLKHFNADWQTLKIHINQIYSPE